MQLIVRRFDLREFFEWTAWEMTPPKAYGTFHLAFFIGGFALSLLIAWLLKNSSEKTNRAVLMGVGIFLAVSEIYRQLFYFYVVGDGSWVWWIFPFQLCDVPLYMCIIAPLLPNGKVQDAMYDFMLAFNLMGGFISFFEPSGLTHEYWTLTLHAFVWHMMLVFVGLYLGLSGRAGKKIADYKRAALVFVCLCAVAFIINCLLWNVSDGTVNMFYVGPRISPIIVFKDIAAKFGWYVNTPIYMLCLCIAAFVFFVPFCLYNGKRLKEQPLKIEE